MRLLAVDDDPMTLELLPRVFSRETATKCTVALSGQAALETLDEAENRFDAILLDIEMPHMDGITLASAIRKIPLYRDVPILMLTAARSEGRLSQAFAAGADDYITKPFEVKDILARVRMANRMAVKNAKAPILTSLKSPLPKHAGEHDFPLDTPARLAGAKHVILPTALGNYLSQLSRNRLDSSTLFAARISGISDHFRQTSTHEFARLLTCAAQSLHSVSGSAHLLMSYEGDGLFMCIAQGTTAPVWPAIEFEVNADLEDQPAHFDDGSPMLIELAVGNPVSPNASRTQRVKKTFDRARERLAQREGVRERTTRRVQSGFGSGGFYFN